jgi:hypothetical protein
VDQTEHFRAMLNERGIKREWVHRTMTEPERTEEPGDGTKHFIRRIPEFESRWLSCCGEHRRRQGKNDYGIF